VRCIHGQVCDFGHALTAIIVVTQGADKDSWFLYPQTKGEVEENVKQLGFERTSIFRPGMIDRGELARTVEVIGSYILSTVGAQICYNGLNATLMLAWILLLPDRDADDRAGDGRGL
jgi:hypothetical protein